ncbi:MAG: hypothetical protein MPW13_18595 [Candidatus Manganitrophus sp.]|nr:hypothetical protein [Candidatus Manganitrophus sp.]
MIRFEGDDEGGHRGLRRLYEGSSGSDVRDLAEMARGALAKVTFFLTLTWT